MDNKILGVIIVIIAITAFFFLNNTATGSVIADTGGGISGWVITIAIALVAVFGIVKVFK